MIALTWRSRKAKLWVEQVPNWTYEVKDMVEHRKEMFTGNMSEIRRAALELFVPRGPMHSTVVEEQPLRLNPLLNS